MRMKAQNNSLTVFQIAMHPLNGICINIRGGHLHGRRKVNNGLPFGGRLPYIIDRVTYFQRKLEFRASVRLW